MSERLGKGDPGVLVGIQYLRALAALCVLIFHAGSRLDEPWILGGAGVDVFFVISGFIMWTITAGRKITPAAFVVDRFLRIAPPYWIATSAMALGGVLGLFPNLVLPPAYVAASFLFLPALSPTNDIAPLLNQGWTLNYEMFFYALFALSLFLKRGARLWAMTLVLLGLVGLGLWLGSEESKAPFLHVYTNAMMLEFLGGIWLAECVARGFRAPVWGALALMWAGLAWFAGTQIAHWYTPEGWAWGPPSLLIVSGVVLLEKHAPLFKSKVLLFLGNGSYSLYLWHTFGVSAALRAGAMAHAPTEITFLLAVAGGLASGTLAYLFIEKPIQAFVAARRKHVQKAA